MGELALIVVHGELHIHGGAGIVLILDLRLGQSRLVVGAQVNGLEALVDIALLEHLAEHLHLFGLKAGVHGGVGMLPVAQDAHALEALALDIHIVLGELLAGGAEVGHAHLLAVELVLLDDGGLDGHAVVIPAGDIGGVVAPHGIAAGDKVLDGLVQGVAHVQGAVRERRAVMQVEQGLALVLFEHLVVDVLVLPAPQHLRLPLGQARPHGEVRLGQIDGLVVVHVSISSVYDKVLFLVLCKKYHRAATAAEGTGILWKAGEGLKRKGRLGVVPHRAEPDRAFGPLKVFQLRPLRCPSKVTPRRIDASILHLFPTGRTLHPAIPPKTKKHPASFSRDRVWKNTLRYHSSCRPLTGSGPSQPAVTGRCVNGHHASCPTRAVFQQEAPR